MEVSQAMLCPVALQADTLSSVPDALEQRAQYDSAWEHAEH